MYTNAAVQPTSTPAVQPISTPAVQNISTPAVQNTTTPTVPHFSSPTVEKISTPVAPPPLESASAAAKPSPFTSYKNKLQEYCQKSKFVMPVYSCNRENGVFTCTVQVAGKAYTSNSCNTKKGSEQTAANVALKALGIV
ncbi:hypothetical protein OS493_027411 [Desmophyllum pertusum]|uniref:DRBM domain-containing protein n=1 Tax=Desmophyllum pertusum TaxID=174260 RepID=A0A9X0CIH0_9CNID|nr:hypothetical protein OS493_027411 [Desmophyllum pertusum]